MNDTLLFLGVASVLGISAAALVVAALALRTARRYVELAEERLESLREGQERLASLLTEERRRASEEAREERGEPALASRRRAEARSTGGAGRALPVPRGTGPGEAPSGGEPTDPSPAKASREVESAWQTARRPEKEASKPAPEASRGDRPPRLSVRLPHPDDDVAPGKPLTGQTRDTGGAPIKMFRTFYDRYLDNYEGYVKLAARAYRMRAETGAAPGSPAEREWQERLRRANDGIRRTTARLDILEEYNPELATDDRISRRAGIARMHSGLEKEYARTKR